MADFMTSPARPFQCTKCLKAFTRQENLKRHTQSHHIGSVARKFACSLCEARFSRSDLLRRHIQTCHPSSQSSIPVSASKPVVESSSLSNISVESTPHAIPTSLAGDVLSSNSQRDIQHFFDKFLCNLPMVHVPTFKQETCPIPMLQAMCCIGSLYSYPKGESPRLDSYNAALDAMYRYVEHDRSKYQETWVLQTFLILEYYGIYSGDDILFLKAQKIHRNLVDAMRELQMSHDGASNHLHHEYTDGPANGNYSHTLDEMNIMEQEWRTFVRLECQKRCIYSIYLLDSELSILCNLRPIISSLEIKHELPCSEELWSAVSADEWSRVERQQFSSFNDHDDIFSEEDTPPAQGGFYLATQHFLNPDRKRKGPLTLRSLWSSPFAAIILVMQLQMMSRELTHASCLLERPKFQKRNLSVLTDSQYTQISQALKNIAELVPQRNSQPAMINEFFRLSMSADEQCVKTDSPLWHNFWMLWHYTSMSLSHPDSLLVTGVVETNLPCAVATAGHLAMPRSREKRDVYEDRDVFRILGNLESVMVKLNGGDNHDWDAASAMGALEDPFTTILWYKMCLVGWRLVRLTMCEAHAQSLRTGQQSLSRNPAMFVLNTIMSCIQKVQENWLLGMLDMQMTSRGLLPILKSEIEFLDWVIAVSVSRETWPVGAWVQSVMQENLAKAKEQYELRVEQNDDLMGGLG